MLRRGRVCVDASVARSAGVRQTVAVKGVLQRARARASAREGPPASRLPQWMRRQPERRGAGEMRSVVVVLGCVDVVVCTRAGRGGKMGH
jgi:hypothetical protein